MSRCVGCDNETNMERVAYDAPDDKIKDAALKKVSVPLCGSCSGDWDEKRDRAKASRGSVSDQGTASSPPHSQETAPNRQK